MIQKQDRPERQQDRLDQLREREQIVERRPERVRAPVGAPPAPVAKPRAPAPAAAGTCSVCKQAIIGRSCDYGPRCPNGLPSVKQDGVTGYGVVDGRGVAVNPPVPAAPPRTS